MALFACAGSTLAQENDLRKRFEAEAPLKWEAYREFSKRLQGSFVVESFDRLADNKRIGRVRIQMKSTDYAKLFMNEFFEPAERHRCWVRNEQYAFELRRQKEADSWTLARLHLDNGKNGKSPIHSFLGGERFGGGGPFLVYEYSLPDLVKRPGFRIIKIEMIHRGNANLVYMEFAYVQSEEEKRNRDVHAERGWFVLDPENYWLVCEYEVKVQWATREKGTVRSRTEWRTNRDGFPVLTKQTKSVQAVGPKGSKVDEEGWTLYNYDETEPGPEEFTLSAFGLPEPKGIVWKHGGSRSWLWLTLVAVSSIALAVLYQKLKQRFASREPVLK